MKYISIILLMMLIGCKSKQRTACDLTPVWPHYIWQNNNKYFLMEADTTSKFSQYSVTIKVFDDSCSAKKYYNDSVPRKGRHLFSGESFYTTDPLDSIKSYGK